MKMKKNLLFLLMALGCYALCTAQTNPVKISPKANHFQYNVYEYGDVIDTSTTHILMNGNDYIIMDEEENGKFVPGYAKQLLVVKLSQDSAYEHIHFEGDANEILYEVASGFSRNDIAFDTAKINGLTRYTCSINSNKLEFYVQNFASDITPIPYYGRFHGILVSYWRNGQKRLELNKTFVDKTIKNELQNPFVVGPFQRISEKEFSKMKRQKMIITHRIFDDEQLCWGKKDDHINTPQWGHGNIPYDSVLHFAGGTLILKKVNLPALPKHYQTFIELHQRSNGDAYDRTGSVFVIPDGYSGPTFFDGINHHPDSLPIIYGRDGQKYQGMVMKRWLDGETLLSYQPPVELMRFFTPFGVGHFNERVKIDGLEWADEAYYKQEVTDLSGYLQGDGIVIGVWIGNYDGGGHKVTLDIKSYPGDYLWDDGSSEGEDAFCQSLFNTCNVLEMAGQNYGKIFGSDSLSVEFDLVNPQNARLRYISTGHGGWGGGDEFNPKTNTLLIDGVPMFSHTPWREDCGCYRQLNPVSGNFWNGVSSSDYSRSGWCPGTTTQPVYFDLSQLKPGKHKLTIAIPQGEPQAGSFSYWSVSGVLITEP